MPIIYSATATLAAVVAAKCRRCSRLLLTLLVLLLLLPRPGLGVLTKLLRVKA